MKRRNFLKFFAAPAAAMAVPVVAKAVPEPEEKPVEKPRPQITDSTVKELLAAKIARCERYQINSHNGEGWEYWVILDGSCQRRRRARDRGGLIPLQACDRCSEPECSFRHDAKIKASDKWEEMAQKVAKEIADSAELLGFRTIWPGPCPEFEPIES